MKRKKINSDFIVLSAVAGLILGAFLGSILAIGNNSYKEISKTTFLPKNATRAMINIPAVDNEGKGVGTSLIVDVVPGSGRILANIDSLFYWVDTQGSIKTATKVAKDITGKDLSNYDIIYTVGLESEATAVQGASAGASITIATIAALENKKIREDIVITGTVNHDGTIGPVSGIKEKAEAAKKLGAKLYLVPLSQGTEIGYDTKEHCEKLGLLSKYCTIEQIPKKINITQGFGIQTIEIYNIRDALGYFLDDTQFII